MTTIADLREALAACEQQPPPLEHFLRNLPPTMDDLLADEVPVVADTTVRKRRRPALWLTAAAVVAALTVGGTVLFGNGGGRTPAGAVQQDQPLASDQLTVPFTIDASSGIKTFEYNVAGGQFAVNLADSSHLYMFVLFASGTGPALVGGQAVDINGAQGHMFLSTMASAEASAASMFSPSRVISASEPDAPAAARAEASAASSLASGAAAEAASEAASARASASATPSAPQKTAQLTFPTPSGGTALLQGLGSPVSEERLLTVARAIHFVAPASSGPGIPSALSLSAAPAGMQLSYIDSSFDPANAAPIKVTASDWQTDVEYDVPASGTFRGVHIDVADAKQGDMTGLAVSPATQGATPVSVAGHSGYWSASKSTLSLVIGTRAFLNIQPVGSWNSNSSYSFAEMAGIAKSVTVAKDPKDRSTWFDAATALPVG